MFSRKLSNYIRRIADELTAEQLLEKLQELIGRGNKITLNYDGWSFAIDFAKHLVGQMQSALDKGEWYGYEPKALKCLDDIPCKENDIIEINSYGFPVAVSDNERFLELLGIADKLYKEDGE